MPLVGWIGYAPPGNNFAQASAGFVEVAGDSGSPLGWDPRTWGLHEHFMTVSIIVEFPVKLANKAKRAGLLQQDTLERMFERALVRQETNPRFLRALEKLSASRLPPMTTEEVDAEITAYRQGKRRRRAGRR